jgi:hypothetical protein
MNQTKKNQLRKFMIETLYAAVEDRVEFADICAEAGIDDAFEAMDFFEKEVGRIDRLFCYPAAQLNSRDT